MEPFKYAAVWQRARVKLRTRKVLESLRRDLSMYGGVAEQPVATQRADVRALRVWWDLLVFVCILYSAIGLPLRRAFTDNQVPWEWSDVGLSLLFACDFAVGLRERKWSARLLDAAACVPAQVADYWLHLAKLYRLLSLARVVKLSLSPSEKALSTRLKNVFHLNQTQLQLLFSLIAICICIHVTTCVFFYAARAAALAPDTWVSRYGMQDEALPSLYLASLYWTVTTFATVGYGDISCFTSAERVIGIMWIFISVYFFSFTLSSLTSLFLSTETRQNVLLEKLSLLHEFAKEARLSRQITRKLSAALRYSSQQAMFSWSSNQELFWELPKALRYQVALAMHKGAAKDLPFFSERSHEFVAAVVPFLQNAYKQSDDVIIKEQEYADEVYFLAAGRVNYVLQRFVYKTLHQGCYFGEVEVLAQVPRKYAVVAAVSCKLLVMRRDVLEGIRTNFPLVWEDMVEVAGTREALCDKAKQEAAGYLAIMKTGQIPLQPEELRAQLAALQEVPTPPTLDSLNERLKLCQSRCVQLHTGLQHTRQSLHTLKDLLIH